MVKTRAKLKVAISKFVKNQSHPFKTTDVQEYAKSLTANIHISPQRLQNYIRANKDVHFNKNLKKWEIKPSGGIKNAKKKQGRI